MGFMFEIEEKINYLNFFLGELSDKIANSTIGQFDSENIQADIESAISEISSIQDEIDIFSGECRYDYCANKYLAQCVGTLEKALNFFSKEITEDTLRAIQEEVAYAYVLWDEKFYEDFDCWSHGLMSQGLYLSKHAVVFDKDSGAEAFIQMMQNALVAESLYFSLERNNLQAALVPIRDDLMFNRQTSGATRPIMAQQLSGRGLITVNIASVAAATNSIAPIELTLQNRLAEVLQWHIQGKTNGTRETVSYGGAKIKYQHQPIVGQLVNMHTSGVGRYGTGKSGRIPNILELVNSLTQQNPLKEQSLAKLLIRYKRGDGNALNEATLQASEMHLPAQAQPRKRVVEQFKKAAYLICFQEVYRRKNQGYRQVNGAVKSVLELPFGLAIVCLLKLIADGHLRFSVALNADCLYGVFTGTSVMSENLIQTVRKFNELFALFVQKYACQDYSVGEYSEKVDELHVCFTPQYFHTLLKAVDGGEADSDDEDYEISPTKASNTQELERLVTRMTIKPLKFEMA